HLTIDSQKLPIVVEGIPIEVDLHGSVLGDATPTSWELSAKITSGAVRLPYSPSGDLQSLHRPGDVTFVDARALRSAIYQSVDALRLRTQKAKPVRFTLDLGNGIDIHTEGSGPKPEIDATILGQMVFTASGRQLSIAGH